MDLWLLLPEFIVLFTAFAIWALDWFTPEHRKPQLGWLAALGVLVAGLDGELDHTGLDGGDVGPDMAEEALGAGVGADLFRIARKAGLQGAASSAMRRSRASNASLRPRPQR